MVVAVHVSLDLMSVRVSRLVWSQAPHLLDGHNYSIHDYANRHCELEYGRFCEFDGGFFARSVCIHSASPERLPTFRFVDVETDSALSVRVGADLRPYICCNCVDACGVCCDGT